MSNALVGTWATRRASFDQIPRDLYTPDPTRASEWLDGYIALSGSSLQLNGRNLFEVAPPSQAFAKALHSFEWLRHVRAYNPAGTDQITARRQAAEHIRQQILNWVANKHRHPACALDPLIAAKRALAITNHGAFLLDDAEPKAYRIIMNAIIADTRFAYTRRALVRDPSDHLYLAMACASVSHALPQHLQLRQITLETLEQALDQALLKDGGPLTRRPGDLPPLLAGLLSLTALMKLRQLVVPNSLEDALESGLQMLRFLRHDDGTLARFQGTDSLAGIQGDLVASVLFHHGNPMPLPVQMPNTKYVRLAAQNSIVLVDCGAPPPPLASCQAHAAALAFEWSHDHAKIVTSAPEIGYSVDAERLDQRQTKAQSTVCINDASSATFLDHSPTSMMINEDLTVLIEDEQIAPLRAMRAQHTGYRNAFGLDHTRSLTLSENGLLLEGHDQLLLPSGQLAVNNRSPFACIFQLQPGTQVKRELGNRFRLVLRGLTVTFEADNGTVTLENPTDRPTYRGRHPAYRIVVNGPTTGPLEVHWRFIVQTGAEPAKSDTKTPSPA